MSDRVHFTSDLHFGHARVVEYSRRPFLDVNEMDAVLVDNWRRVVAPGDRVYVLGDFSFHGPEKTATILDRLPGQKYLILGNHCRVDERRWADVARRFVWVRHYAEVKVREQRIALLHFAMRVWHQSHRGAWHLYGHSHGSLPDDPHALSMDVGVDAVAARWAAASDGVPHPDYYRPISFNEVAAHMATKTWRAVDHHGARS